ncbi:uncharacterized protein F4822DRAFT_230075 [Hypoxylon trugodes]|uniref:uncharacterized protein n=1 Tax=Hypoxylon trugodes TaxID=326681 RepID=UPI00218F3DA1|nr:uncharacterized protein F4822DRAFT_230075 [Hypoxylon trugodes]KAI1390240.1 hypothetical protein F4822DRAFT_230075 [Hypoxylon trugodes]
MAPHTNVLSLFTMLATTSLLALAQEPPVPSPIPSPIFANVTIPTTPTIVTADDGRPGPADPIPGKPGPNLRIIDDNPVYKYVGCWSETTPVTPEVHALEGPYLTVPGLMKVSACLGFCSMSHNKHDPTGEKKGYRYAGLEFSRECWCGDTLSEHSFHLVDSACDTPCDGANTTACGGHLALTLYNITEKTPGDGNDGGNGNNGGNGNDDNGDKPGDEKPPSDQAVLQAVSVGVLVVAVTFALGWGCL